MISGIYKLYWTDIPTSTYIGRSLNIEKRIRQHYYLLENNAHHNYKLQQIYNKCLILPRYEIIEEVYNTDCLQDREVYWVTLFDTIQNGANIAEPGTVGYGENHGSSKYSKLDYLKAFRYLYLSKYKFYTYKEISAITGITVDILKDIRQNKSHCYLRTLYPYQYNLMNKIDRTLNSKCNSKNTITYKIRDPYNVIHEVTGIREFARKHSLNNGHLSRLLNGKIKQHKGWSLEIKSSI